MQRKQILNFLFEQFTEYQKSPTISVKKLHVGDIGQADIATYTLNQPRSRFSANLD